MNQAPEFNLRNRSLKFHPRPTTLPVYNNNNNNNNNIVLVQDEQLLGLLLYLQKSTVSAEIYMAYL